MSHNTSTKDPLLATRHWLDTMVVGLNLCPFAGQVLRDNSLRIEVCGADTEEALISAVLTELDVLQRAEEAQIATSLLVFSQNLWDFDQYLALLDLADELLVEVGLEGVIQIASFHPDYCFEGVPPHDPSHYSNRSPYPMLHFLREEQLQLALASYPNPEQIPENNISRLRELGTTAILALLAQ